MPPVSRVSALTHINLYLSPEERWQCLRSQHARDAIETALHRLNNPYRPDWYRHLVCPLALSAGVVAAPCEPLTIVVDAVGAIAAKAIGYSLALCPATIGALAGLFSANPAHAQHVGDNFWATLLVFEKVARIPLQALPVTLCLHGFKFTASVLCGAAKVLCTVAERQMVAHLG